MIDGGPAFPVTSEAEYNGMSLREWFAGMAMNGLIRAEDEHNEHGVAGFAEIADQAFTLADAMLAEAAKKPEAHP